MRGRGEEFGEGGFQGSVGCIGQRAVGLPGDATMRIGEEDVRAVRQGEVDELLPFVFVIEDGDEMGLLVGGHAFAHAAENHGANKGRGGLEYGKLIVSDASV